MMLEGVRLMVVGMFTVFAFLSLLVAVMKLSAAFFEANAHRFPQAEPADTVGGAKKRSNDARGDEEVAVAIALASALRQGQRV